MVAALWCTLVLGLARKADKAKRLAKARANTKNKEASKAFFAVASKEGDVVF